jgi:p-hydroxybenzoate 3-monooxygenase
MRTQIGIIGAGPAGLFLSHLLRREGIDCVVLESRSRAYVEDRVRAGVLEQGTVDLLDELGLAGRLRREGVVDDGFAMRFRGKIIRIALAELTHGRSVTIYGQQEVVKDLIAASEAAGHPVLFEAEATAIDGLDGERPVIRFRHEGRDETLECDFVAGCDGYHGISRVSVPPNALTTYDRHYDFAWLGVLAHARPLPDLTYSNSDRGFALCSSRSPQISRLYLQVGATVDPSEWPAARFWDELHARMFDAGHDEIAEGEIFQSDVARLRALVVSPMQYGPLFLAGDAVHIVPPTGAKGLNLAVADARTMARGFADFYRTRTREHLGRYSEVCLRRVWKTVRFSTMMTALLHKLPEQTPFERELQLTELDYILGSRAAQMSIAEQYVGLPFEEL